MLHLETAPVSQSPFADIVKSTAWTIDPRNLAVAKDYNFLVTTPSGEQPGYNLVFFSEIEANQEIVGIPDSVEDVRARIGTSALGMINRDWTAKGLGFTGANSPLAIHYPDKAGTVAARIVPLVSGIKIRRHEENNSKVAQNAQWLRHAGLIIAAGLGDIFSSDYAGTRKAMSFMERDYGDAQVVIRNAPPTWQTEQAKLGIKSEIPPKKVLIRPSAGDAGVHELAAIGAVWPTDLLR